MYLIENLCQYIEKLCQQFYFNVYVNTMAVCVPSTGEWNMTVFNVLLKGDGYTLYVS